MARSLILIVLCHSAFLSFYFPNTGVLIKEAEKKNNNNRFGPLCLICSFCCQMLKNKLMKLGGGTEREERDISMALKNSVCIKLTSWFWNLHKYLQSNSDLPLFTTRMSNAEQQPKNVQLTVKRTCEGLFSFASY